MLLCICISIFSLVVIRPRCLVRGWKIGPKIFFFRFLKKTFKNPYCRWYGTVSVSGPILTQLPGAHRHVCGRLWVRIGAVACGVKTEAPPKLPKCFGFYLLW